MKIHRRRRARVASDSERTDLQRGLSVRDELVQGLGRRWEAGYKLAKGAQPGRYVSDEHPL